MAMSKPIDTNEVKSQEIEREFFARNYIQISQIIEPAKINSLFKSMSSLEFKRLMNFLGLASGSEYVCEVLGVNLDSQEFATHCYSEITPEVLLSLSDRKKLKLIHQLLKLSLYLKSINIANFSLSQSNFYLYYLSDSDFTIKFWNFSDSYYHPNDQNSSDSKTLDSILEIILDIFPPSSYPRSEEDLIKKLKTFIASINKTKLKKRIRNSLNISIFISFIFNLKQSDQEFISNHKQSDQEFIPNLKQLVQYHNSDIIKKLEYILKIVIKSINNS